MWFVMIYNQKDDGVMPLMDDEKVAVFEDVMEAHKVATENLAATTFGYEVFEM